MLNTRDDDRDGFDATAKGMRSNRPVSGNMGDFLSWWGSELAGLAPASLRKAFEPGGGEVATVQEVDGHVVLRRRTGAAAKTLTPGGKTPGGMPNGGVIYLLPEDGALRRERRLPAASRSHIQDIMNLQMASETPFTVDEVYTDAIITAELDASREISVSQALVPRPAIDDIIQRLRQLHGLELTGVDVADTASPKGRAGFNLLPPELRPRTSRGQFSGVRILLFVLAGAAVFAGMSWRDLQQRRIQAADALIANTEGGAAGAMQVSARLAQGVEAIQRLAAQQADPAAFLRVYHELARVLPDGTWLEEFSYDRPTAFMTGLSSSAATLVEALESSDMVERARFASPTVTDSQSGAERFRLEVTIKGSGAAPAPAAEPQP